MSIPPEALGTLFEMSRDPVVGIDDTRTVVFANPPAAALLHTGPGAPAGDVVPEHILCETADRFLASARIGAVRASASVVRMSGIAVCTFTLPREETVPPPGARALHELSSSLMSARLAIDALVSHTRAEADPILRETSAILYREYYRLLRTCRHMTLAAGVATDDLPYKPRVTDLREMCRQLCDTVGHLSESRGVSVVFRTDPGLHLTMADQDLLEIMLLNLMTNSLLHCRTGDAIRVELSRQDDRFILAVQDPGSGMPPEQLAQAFSQEPAGGSTDPTAGAGLGLYIARGIAERHGGSVILESRPGKGTAVRISIPYRQSEDMTAHSPAPPYRSDGMNSVLMELSPLLDKVYFTKRMFD